MQTFNTNGNAIFSGTWSTITSARKFNKNLINIPPEATHWVRYSTGATAALVIGETLTGGTSAATAILVAQAVENGTAGSSDSGILLLRKITGSPTTTGETWTGGTSTGTIATGQSPIFLIGSGGRAKAVLLTVETASANIETTGATATVTAGTNVGHTVVAGGSYAINDYNNVASVSVINSVNANNSIVKYSLYF